MTVRLTGNDFFQLVTNLAASPPETDLIEAFIHDINPLLGEVRLVRVGPNEPLQDHQFRLSSEHFEFDTLQLMGKTSHISMEMQVYLANATHQLSVLLNQRAEIHRLREQNRMFTEKLDYQRKQLANLESTNRDFMDGITDIIISVDRVFNITSWNPAAERFTGVGQAQALNHSLWEVLSEFRTPEIEMALIETETTRRPSSFLQLITRNLKDVYLQITVYPGSAGFFLFAQDQTRAIVQERENKAFMEKLRHAQKLESLGVLAGGIAHDFNNLLLGILGNVSLAMMDLKPDSTPYQCLVDIEQAAKRAADLSSQMLAYSGRGKFIVDQVDATQLIQEMSNLVKASLPRAISIEYDLNPGCLPFTGDSTQIHQALMNVILNASESIEGEGTIRISTRPVVLTVEDISACYLSENVSPGPYTQIRIEDTGTGMDEHTLARIFDPFFSTKFTGRGLGLAAALGIVRAHNGTLNVNSTVHNGTRFEMYFPAEVPADEPRVNETSRFTTTWNGSGIVLFVDDEETVRNVGKRLLKRMGFEVLLANDGVEAVEMFARYGETIGLVILDMTMPRMDGKEALEQIKQIRPDVKIVLSTGYSERDVATNFQGRGFDAFIQKPYNYRELKDLVRMVLASTDFIKS
ncbi:response regulator [Myxococcota bacterium]|nr:response regulator [Myxococcota bacterium]